MVGNINIYGQIGSFDGQKGVELVDVISQVRKQPEATGFNVYIDSPGGIVDTGFDIYNYLKSLGLPITTIGEGTVASIATVIFMAGHRRIVSPDTEFMIHLPMGGIEFATASEMEDYTKQMKQVENEIVNFYAKELGLGKEALFPLLRNETWLTQEQLVDLGFVTTSTDMQVAAIAKKSKSKINNKMSNKKGKLRKILDILKGDDAVAKMIFTADEKELVFPEIEEDGVIEVGAKATYDGQPAEGEIVGQDGKTYVFEGGILAEIIDPSAEEEVVTEDEMIEALVETLELVSGLTERVEKVESEAVGIKAENDELKAKLEKAEKTINALKGKSEPPKDEKKDKGKGDNQPITAAWLQKRKIKNQKTK